MSDRECTVQSQSTDCSPKACIYSHVDAHMSHQAEDKWRNRLHPLCWSLLFHLNPENTTPILQIIIVIIIIVANPPNFFGGGHGSLATCIIAPPPTWQLQGIVLKPGNNSHSRYNEKQQQTVCWKVSAWCRVIRPTIAPRHVYQISWMFTRLTPLRIDEETKCIDFLDCYCFT